MKTALELLNELIPNNIQDYFGYIDNYQPLIDNIGEVLVQVDDDDYQGDSRVLLKENDRFGFLVFGWGSCCGCDALQACESAEDLQELMDSLYNSIKWFSTLDEAKNYILDNYSRETEFYYHETEWEDFLHQVENYN